MSIRFIDIRTVTVTYPASVHIAVTRVDYKLIHYNNCCISIGPKNPVSVRLQLPFTSVKNSMTEINEGRLLETYLTFVFECHHTS